MSKVPPTPSEDDVIASLRLVGFKVDDDDLRQLLRSKDRGLKAVATIVKAELKERQIRNLAQRTRMASLGKCKSLDEFDWTHPRTIDRALFEQLTTLTFVEDSYNVLFRGPSGTGKTTLAKHLGFKVLQAGGTVKLTTLADMIAELLSQESIPALSRRMRKFTRPDLLIVDEIGYLACKTDAVDVFFNVISQRHEIGSTIVTTNLAFKEWAKVFQGAACVNALVDRFVQHCFVIDVDACR